MLLRPAPSVLLQALSLPAFSRRASAPARRMLSSTAAAAAGTVSPEDAATAPGGPRKNPWRAVPPPSGILRTALFLPPGVERDAAVAAEMVLPGSNIVVGPYAGDAKVKEAEYVGSSTHARDCPKDDRPEFAILGRSNVGKSSLINALTRRKEAALTSKKPGKTQTINHFLVNKSWYLVDLPGYGDTLVGVLLLIDASVPPQKIDLDCANWLGRNNFQIGLTFVFTKCDKVKKGKGGRPEENIKEFQDTISGLYQDPPPWIMTSSVTGLGRDGLLLHMSQLRNYWDNEAV